MFNIEDKQLKLASLCGKTIPKFEKLQGIFKEIHKRYVAGEYEINIETAYNKIKKDLENYDLSYRINIRVLLMSEIDSRIKELVIKSFDELVINKKESELIKELMKSGKIDIRDKKGLVDLTMSIAIIEEYKDYLTTGQFDDEIINANEPEKLSELDNVTRMFKIDKDHISDIRVKFLTNPNFEDVKELLECSKLTRDDLIDEMIVAYGYIQNINSQKLSLALGVIKDETNNRRNSE